MNEIVTAVQFRDALYIFCRDGKVYRMQYDETGYISFTLMHEMFR